MNKQAHTPTPWIVSDNGFFVYSHNGLVLRVTCNGNNDEERKANAAFIVKAVNCHDRLIAEVEVLCIALQDICAVATFHKDQPTIDRINKALSLTAKTKKDGTEDDIEQARRLI